jgi:hypothetical protein
MSFDEGKLVAQRKKWVVNKGKMGGSSFMVLLNDFGRLTLRKRFS